MRQPRAPRERLSGFFVLHGWQVGVTHGTHRGAASSNPFNIVSKNSERLERDVIEQLSSGLH